MKRLVALAALLAACAGAQQAGPAPRDPIADPARRAGRPLVMIAMPQSASFRTVRRTLVDELKKEFDVHTHVVRDGAPAADLARAIDEARPTCMVLMDNPTVKMYRDYQLARRDAAPPPPAVVVMASFLEEVRAELQNATGVAYEVPGVTAFVNLRSVISRPVGRVGVLHRPGFRRFIERQKALADREQITLVPIEVSAEPSATEVRDALRKLRQGVKVDALWILNDNALLRDARFVASGWRSELDAMAVPVVVGVPSLVSAQAGFGTFAVLPDHEGLGVQAANLVFDLSESGWRANDHPVELPVATITVINLRQARARFGLREGALLRIDRTVE